MNEYLERILGTGVAAFCVVAVAVLLVAVALNTRTPENKEPKK